MLTIQFTAVSQTPPFLLSGESIPHLSGVKPWLDMSIVAQALPVFTYPSPFPGSTFASISIGSRVSIQPPGLHPASSDWVSTQ